MLSMWDSLACGLLTHQAISIDIDAIAAALGPLPLHERLGVEAALLQVRVLPHPKPEHCWVCVSCLLSTVGRVPASGLT